MIDPDELRRGNWILTEEGESIQVEEISGLSINLDSHGEDWVHYYERLSPIPLTSDILSKTEFVWHTDTLNTWYKLRHMKLYHHGSKYYFSPYEWNFQLEIKSLHQLQNLYFALTGDEIKYKP